MCDGAKASTANGKVEAECIHFWYEQRKYTASSLANLFAQTQIIPGPFCYLPLLAPPTYLLLFF